MVRKRHPPNLRAVLKTLRADGFKPAVHRGKHFRVEWFGRDGRPCRVIVSNTPSSWNASKMALGDVRRALRQAGAAP
jgi:hypothetical protein